MNGVEILSSTEVASEFAFNWTAFWIVTAAWFVICLVIYLFAILECEVLPCTIGMIVLWIVVSAILGALFGAVLTPITTEYTTEYKIYLEGDVNMTEFAEKYEILDQEGKIYTVKERE